MQFTTENNRLNEIIKDVGRQHGLTAEQSYSIMLHQFEFLRDVMKSGDIDDPDTFKTTNLVYIGRFNVHTRTKKRIQLNNEQLF